MPASFIRRLSSSSHRSASARIPRRRAASCAAADASLGTGRARAGSTRSPLWVGGGTVFGPHPRKYGFTMPRKQRRLALKCALSDKVRTGDFIVLDQLDFDAPKTKAAVKLLSDFGVHAKSLFITADEAVNVERSTSNIPGVKAITASGINVFDILHHDKLFITKDAITRIEEVFA